MTAGDTYPGVPREALGRCRTRRCVEKTVIGSTTVGGETVEVRRFMGYTPHRDTTGGIESMALYAGQGLVS